MIAHELGHVQHRDGLHRIIQTGSTSFLIGLLFGDIAGGGAIIFVVAARAERIATRAPASATPTALRSKAMTNLGRARPRPLGELLVRVTDLGGKPVEGLHHHRQPSAQQGPARPHEPGRRDRGISGAPILTDAEWQALKSICVKGSKV